MDTAHAATRPRSTLDRLTLASAVGVGLYIALAAAFGVRLGALAHGAMASSCLLLTVAALNGGRGASPRAGGRSLGTGLLLAALVVVLLATWGFNSLKRGFLLGYMPGALQVEAVLYEDEERWGLPLLALPGDNETGLRIYALPDEAAIEVEHGGVDWLEAMSQGAHAPSRRERGIYSGWRRTPLDDAARMRVTRVDTDGVGDCGFCLRVEPATWAQVEDILDRPGSFYALGRSGVIVVSPRHRRVLYMFNG